MWSSNDSPPFIVRVELNKKIIEFSLVHTVSDLLASKLCTSRVEPFKDVIHACIIFRIELFHNDRSEHRVAEFSLVGLVKLLERFVEPFGLLVYSLKTEYSTLLRRTHFTKVPFKEV